MFNQNASIAIDYPSKLLSFKEKAQTGWNFYKALNYEAAIDLFKNITGELLGLKKSADEENKIYIANKINSMVRQLKLAVYFCLCHKQDNGLLAAQYANEERLFAPGAIQFDEILISNQAIIAINSDSSTLIKDEYLAAFENDCRLGNVDPIQIVSEQIFRDGNHRTAVWYIYLAEIKNHRIKDAACDAYKLYAVLARERFRQANHRDPNGFYMKIYQEQYANKRTYDIDGAAASNMRYEKFLEVFRLDRFLFRLIGDGSFEGRKSFKRHFERHRQQGARAAHLIYENMQFLDPPLAVDASLNIKRELYEQWKRYYNYFIALGGAGGGDGANL